MIKAFQAACVMVEESMLAGAEAARAVRAAMSTAREAVETGGDHLLDQLDDYIENTSTPEPVAQPVSDRKARRAARKSVVVIEEIK